MPKRFTPPRWAVVLAVLGAAALPLFVSLPSKPNVIARLHDFAHAPLFAGIAIALACLLSGWSRPLRYALALTIAVFIGAGIELLQSLIGRSAEWSDLATDTAGAAAGLALAATFSAQTWRARFTAGRITLGVMGLAVLLGAAWPLLNALAAQILRADRFPVLLTAETGLDAYFLHAGDNTAEVASLPEVFGEPGVSRAYRVHLRPVKWSGIALFEPAPDWRGYSTLVIELVNPAAQPLLLTLRIHDQQHNQAYDDRLNMTVELPPGQRTVLRIPLEEIATAPTSRRMDMAHIDGLGLFSHENLPPEGATFYLVAIRLE